MFINQIVEKAISLVLPIKPKIELLNVYITNRCNSMCSICGIWRSEPKVDMSINLIEKLLNDPVAEEATFCLQGGEFFLHPHLVF